MTELRYYVLYLTFCMSLLACSEEQKEVKHGRMVGITSLKLTNPKLLSVISDYIALNETDGRPKVYRVIIEQGNGDVLFKLTYIRNYSEVLMHLPTAYFKERGRVVLINSGLEAVSKLDSTFIRDLEDVILPNLVDDVRPDNNGSVRAPISYYAEVWDIEVHKGDSLTVNRNGKAPYVKYLPEDKEIKFEPPKK